MNKKFIVSESLSPRSRRAFIRRAAHRRRHIAMPTESGYGWLLLQCKTPEYISGALSVLVRSNEAALLIPRTLAGLTLAQVSAARPDHVADYEFSAFSRLWFDLLELAGVAPGQGGSTPQKCAA